MSQSTYVAPTWQPPAERILDQADREIKNATLGAQQKRYSGVGRVGKLRAFPNEQLAYDAGIWMRCVVAREFNHVVDRTGEDYCNGIGLDVVNVGHEGSGPTGGYVVPAPLLATIIDTKERVGVSRKALRVLPATSDTLTVPRKVGGLTVYYPGEGNAISDSDVAWAQVTCNLRKRAVLTYLTNELVDDAIISVIDDAFMELSFALALQEDNELINGNGTSSYGGVRGLLSSIGAGGVSTAPSGHDTWPELDLNDFATCVGKLPDKYHVYEPAWICSHSFFNQVMARLAYAAGGTTMAEIMGGVGNVRSFLGYPVFLTPWMPTATATSTVCCLFGAYTQAAILADRGAPRLARSDEYKFAEDKVTLRATERHDIVVFDAGTASAAGAYVALATAAN
jgi:HK97 family phage major capsid protein